MRTHTIVATKGQARVVVTLYGEITDERIARETQIAQWRARQLS